MLLHSLSSFVVCAPTFFHNVQDTRYNASLATLARCHEHGFNVVLVDGSPVETGIPKALEDAGASVFREEGRGKGNALRQALRVAAEKFPNAQVFAFQELEKTDFVRFYESLVPSMLDTPHDGGSRWDFCNPARSNESWASYPIEQVHEERFQNRLMDLVAKKHNFSYSLDWSFGPFLFQREHLHTWLNYKGQTYDAQWGPMISAFQSNKSIVVGTPMVDYQHTQGMKEEEEGNLECALRRMNQLQDCIRTHQAAWDTAGS